jgi:hypothetical protein
MQDRIFRIDKPLASHGRTIHRVRPRSEAVDDPGNVRPRPEHVNALLLSSVSLFEPGSRFFVPTPVGAATPPRIVLDRAARVWILVAGPPPGRRIACSPAAHYIMLIESRGLVCDLQTMLPTLESVSSSHRMVGGAAPITVDTESGQSRSAQAGAATC